MAMMNYQSYIDILDPDNFTHKGIAYPADFSCQLTKSGGGSISFSLPLNEKLIDVGSLVNYNASDFGGVIRARDIDLKTKTVRYKGHSWYGVMSDFVIETGNSDRTIWIYSGYIDDQVSLNSASYPNNGPYPLLHYIFETFELPFRALSPHSLIRPPSGEDWAYTIKLGTTLKDYLQKFDNINVPYNYVIKYAPNRNEGTILTVRLDDIQTYTDHSGIEMFGESPELIITQAMRTNIVFDHSTIHYFVNDNTYKSAVGVYTYGMPADRKYKELNQISVWNPNSDSNETNQENLRNLRENNARGQVSSEITLPYLGYRFPSRMIDYANIGDIIDYYDPKYELGFKQRLIAKTLNIKNGVPTVTFSFGGEV